MSPAGSPWNALGGFRGSRLVVGFGNLVLSHLPTSDSLRGLDSCAMSNVKVNDCKDHSHLLEFIWCCGSLAGLKFLANDVKTLGQTVAQA